MKTGTKNNPPITAKGKTVTKKTTTTARKTTTKVVPLTNPAKGQSSAKTKNPATHAKKSWMLKIIIMAVVIVLMAVGGAYYFHNHSDNQVATLEKTVQEMQAKVDRFKKHQSDSVVPTPTKSATEAGAVIEKIVDSPNDSLILHMWKGPVALLHELNASADKGKSKSQFGNTKFELDNAKEKEAQLKDLVKQIRKNIADNEYSAALERNSLSDPNAIGSGSANIKMGWRKDIRHLEEKIEELKEQLQKTSAELQVATAKVANLSRD